MIMKGWRGMVSSSHPQGEKETMERGQGTCPRVGFAGRAPVSRFPKLVSGERGSVALYLLKLLIPFVILGFIISQAGPIVWNQIYTRIMASDVGDYALQIYRENNGNMEKVNVKVREMVVERGGRLVGDALPPHLLPSTLHRGQGRGDEGDPVVEIGHPFHRQEWGHPHEPKRTGGTVRPWIVKPSPR
jgi:hypothetical protein